MNPTIQLFETNYIVYLYSSDTYGSMWHSITTALDIDVYQHLTIVCVNENNHYRGNTLDKLESIYNLKFKEAI